MPKRIYRVGTRRSRLALKQVEEVARAVKLYFPEFAYEIISMDTYGDKDKLTPISEIEGSDFFTREIEEALLRQEIDFAVHSAKDLPDEIPQGLVIVAQTPPIDNCDALVCRAGNLTIEKLPKGAKVGASSLRRKAQLKKYRRDLQVMDVRGTIEERLEKLDAAAFDAVVVAACALMRLGLEHRITQRIPLDILTPHPLQGALAIEVRAGDKEMMALLSRLDARNNRQIEAR